MKRHSPTIFVVFVVLLCLVLAGAVRADTAAPDAPQAGAPAVVSYQGQVTVGGAAYTGTGHFKLAVVDQAGTTSIWSNDGTSAGGGPPTNAVVLAVSGGLFNVLLGDTSLANMTALPATVFGNTGSYLRVWFSSDGANYTQLSPDRRIASAPYALQAQEAANTDTLDAQHGSYYQSASNLTAGTLNNARFSAHSDLAAEGYLGDAPGDLAQNNGTLQTGLNADALDSHHASNASGDIPLSNATLNADLNADLLDGVRAGNGSGYIALNNGIRNFNLNADMVDGSHTGNASGNVALNNGTVNTNLNADLLDGKHAGNANGNVPLSNGTLNTNLNADLFDGYHAGNANGNVPLSNGSLNSNLNADMVDGKHATELDSQHRATPPQPNTAPTLDTAAAGLYNSVTIGTDGLPVMSYSSSSFGLRVLHCGNVACSSGNSIATVDGGVSGEYNSIAIGADGLPVISYYNEYQGDLRVLHCGDVACSSNNSIANVDSAVDVGAYSSIAIGSDGFPVVSYYDTTNGDLKLLHCGSADCLSNSSWAPVDTAGAVGLHTSIAISGDGMPVVSYVDVSNGLLKVLKCSRVDCSSGNSLQTPIHFTAGTAILNTSIAVAVDGLPVISYEAWYNNVSYAELLHCTTEECAYDNQIFPANAGFGSDTAVTIGADNVPILAFIDNADRLKIARCRDAACMFLSPNLVVETVASNPAITIGADGLPVVSYYDFTDHYLKVMHCSNTMCSPYMRRR